MKNIRYGISLLFLLVINSLVGFGLSLDIRVFSSSTVTQMSFTPISGKYVMKADNLPLSADIYKNNLKSALNMD